MWIRPLQGGGWCVMLFRCLCVNCLLCLRAGGAPNWRFHRFIEGKTFILSVCVHSIGIDLDGFVYVLRISVFLTLPAFSVVMS